MGYNPIICALDTPSMGQAVLLATELKGSVGLVKLGLEFFVANGPQGVAAVADAEVPIFLDLKFHDIPNTVAGAVRSAAGLGVHMLTIHASGGVDMIKAAVAAAAEFDNAPKILAVTVLTSMSDDDIRQVTSNESLNASMQVKNLAESAVEAGVDGVVCSPRELSDLSHLDVIKVVPGVRREQDAVGDQKRVMTPKEAIANGASYLVIGRPITQSTVPKDTAIEIFKEIS